MKDGPETGMAEHSHTELRRLFDLVIETPRELREGVLARECRGDVALRRRIEAMVATAEGEEFLSDPTVAMVSADPADARTSDGVAEGPVGSGEFSALIDGPGTRIGSYKLLQLIGEGGFGTVFMAEQEQPVRRKVALKIIKLGMDTRQVVARFEQERQALAMMDHPNIAKVFDAGATQAGRPYFVMELVKGEPIVEYCDRNSLGISERLELFTRVSSAVQHAHTKGIIHRDIKPSNILVSTQDGRPHPKVIDFGIAKATASKLTEKTLFTEHRALIGTPEYMSPEQADGSLDIDTRTDVYSLGVLLYELLTGTTPFSGNELRSAAYAEIQRIIREVEPPVPSTRLSQQADTIASIAAKRRTEPGRLGALIRGELDWIVMRALEKDRSRRYATANDLAMDVGRYLSGEPVAAAPPARAYKFRKFVSRNRGKVTAGVLVGSAILLGLIGTSWGLVWALNERERANDAAVAERQALRQARERTESLEKVTKFQAEQLSGIDVPLMGVRLRDGLLRKVRVVAERSHPAPGDLDARIKEVERLIAGADFTGLASESLEASVFQGSLAAINRQFGDQPLVKAQLLQTVAEALVGVGLLQQAIGPQAEALEIRRAVLGEVDPVTLESVRASAILRGAQGKYDEAAPLFAEVLNKRRRVLGNEHRETLKSIFEYGTLHYVQGHYAEAEPLFLEALEGRKQTLPEGDPDRLESIRAMGLLRLAQGRLAEAEALQREAVEACGRSLGAEHADTLRAAAGLSDALKWQYKYAEAEEVDRRVVDGRRRLLGDDHPDTLTAMSSLGETLRNLKKLPEAGDILREALQRQRRVLGDDHPDTLVSISRLGMLLYDLGKLDDAYPYYRETLEGRRRRLGNEHANTMTSLSNMGFLLQKMGRLAEAEAFYREALEARLRISGRDHPATLTTLFNIGTLQMAQNHFSESEATIRDVLDRRRKVLGTAHPETLNTIQVFGTLQMKTGKLVEAEQAFGECLRSRRNALPRQDPRIYETLGLLGEAVAMQRRFSEAELILKEAYAGLETAGSAGLRSDVARRLADCYEAWNKAEPGGGYGPKATEWAAKAAATPAPAESR
ncbi:MAG: serine/threonine protein kinase [Planctomycetes bacterium]|nr:serine/threonine protein kinase [Planctomycetota bacterium]